jgi:hypothetical protein
VLGRSAEGDGVRHEAAEPAGMDGAEPTGMDGAEPTCEDGAEPDPESPVMPAPPFPTFQSRPTLPHQVPGVGFESGRDSRAR